MTKEGFTVTTFATRKQWLGFVGGVSLLSQLLLVHVYTGQHWLGFVVITFLGQWNVVKYNKLASYLPTVHVCTCTHERYIIIIKYVRIAYIQI